MVGYGIFVCLLFCLILIHTTAFSPTTNVWRVQSAIRRQPLRSTVISPPKVDRTGTKKGTQKKPADPDFLFKESRDIQKEFEEYCNDEKYHVILYNDPFNKRLYVQQCLMEVLSFSEKVAEDVMLCAHNYGFAVAGEYGKEIAIEHAKKLVEKGLIAEAKESDEPSGGDSSS